MRSHAKNCVFLSKFSLGQFTMQNLASEIVTMSRSLKDVCFKYSRP